jgi:hypothetical protein
MFMICLLGVIVLGASWGLIWWQTLILVVVLMLAVDFGIEHGITMTFRYLREKSR